VNVTPESSTVVAGRKPVLAALASTDVNIECVYLRRDMKNSIAAEIRKICGEQGIPVKFVPQEKLNRLTEGTLHQGVVAVTTAIELLDLESMLADIAPSWDDTMRLKPLLLIPDRISDPHNLGAIVRSAAAFGCSGVILPERNSAPLGSTTIKASAGAALSMRFARVGNVGAGGEDQLVSRLEPVVAQVGDAGQEPHLIDRAGPPAAPGAHLDAVAFPRDLDPLGARRDQHQIFQLAARLLADHFVEPELRRVAESGLHRAGIRHHGEEGGRPEVGRPARRLLRLGAGGREG